MHVIKTWLIYILKKLNFIHHLLDKILLIIIIHF